LLLFFAAIRRYRYFSKKSSAESKWTRPSDDFFLNQSDLHQGVFLAAIKRIRQSLKKPAKTPDEYLGVLRKHSLVKIAEFLENYVDLI
jgi:hypothetical protein